MSLILLVKETQLKRFKKHIGLYLTVEKAKKQSIIRDKTGENYKTEKIVNRNTPAPYKFMIMHKIGLKPFFQAISWLGMPEFYAVVVILLALTDFKLAVRLGIAIALVEVIGGLIKIIFPKTRPVPMLARTFHQKWESGSFPSIHSARTTTVGIFLIKAFGNWPIISISLLMALGVGYSRIYLKKHYFLDVIAGFAVGTIISLIILAL